MIVGDSMNSTIISVSLNIVDEPQLFNSATVAKDPSFLVKIWNVLLVSLHQAFAIF